MRRKLIVSKMDEAKEILRQIGMPEQQCNDIAGYTFLTLANQEEKSTWKDSKNNWIRIHDVLIFTSEKYNKEYAENTRETIRKQCMHQFREGALIEDNGKATNSPNYRYKITDEALALIQTFGTPLWAKTLKHFLKYHEALVHKYASKKKMEMLPIKINNQELLFSSGKHNALQKAIIEDFAPRFAPYCECLYIGDTIKKDLIKNVQKLAKLGFEITLHDKMPDIVLYREDTDWIYFIEAVTSVGPMNAQRIIEIESMTKNVTSGKIYVTAFLNFKTYKKFSAELAWETEVWIAEMPEHMIHLNGKKFLGPRK